MSAVTILLTIAAIAAWLGLFARFYQRHRDKRFEVRRDGKEFWPGMYP